MLAGVLNFILDDSGVAVVEDASADNTESIVFLAVVWFILGIVTALVVGTVIILVSYRNTNDDEESVIESVTYDIIEKPEL